LLSHPSRSTHHTQLFPASVGWFVVISDLVIVIRKPTSKVWLQANNNEWSRMKERKLKLRTKRRALLVLYHEVEAKEKLQIKLSKETYHFVWLSKKIET
jgi:hypothetical protein